MRVHRWVFAYELFAQCHEVGAVLSQPIMRVSDPDDDRVSGSPDSGIDTVWLVASRY
jgi:hypothetical protein